MKRIWILAVVVLPALFAVSCSEKKDKTPDWGVTEAFDDFLFKKYEPEMMVRTLVLEPNQDAKKESMGPLRFHLIQDVEGKTIPVNSSVAQVYVNGEPASNNIFEVPADAERVEVGIKMAKSLTDKKTYYFRLAVENPGYEMINDIPVDGGQIELDDFDTNLKIVVKHVSNSLKVLVIWILIILASLFVAWMFFLKPIIFKHFRFDELKIVYMEDNVRKGAPQDVTLRKARKLILGNDVKRQSAFNRFWTGRILYLEDPYWSTEVEITPCGSDGLSFTEALSENPTYRTKSAMIESVNGPKRPFVVTKRGSNVVANISIN